MWFIKTESDCGGCDCTCMKSWQQTWLLLLGWGEEKWKNVLCWEPVFTSCVNMFAMTEEQKHRLMVCSQMQFWSCGLIWSHIRLYFPNKMSCISGPVAAPVSTFSRYYVSRYFKECTQFSSCYMGSMSIRQLRFKKNSEQFKLFPFCPVQH